MNSICVFCGSSTGYNEAYRRETELLGKELAGRKIRLVYGGGNVGLMGLLAETVLKAKGEVLGIIPEAINSKVRPLEGGRTVVVDNMHTRKMMMHDESDGFIALPGGIGTFEEILEAFTWSQLGFHTKPVALFNIENFYKPMLDQFHHAVREGFFKESHLGTLLVNDKAPDLLNQMEHYIPLKEDKWITGRHREDS